VAAFARAVAGDDGAHLVEATHRRLRDPNITDVERARLRARLAHSGR